MKRGRKFAVDPEEVLKVVSSVASLVFANGQQVGASNDVYTHISELLDGRMSPKAIYLFLKKNSIAQASIGKWLSHENQPSGVVVGSLSPGKISQILFILRYCIINTGKTVLRINYVRINLAK